MRIPTLKNRSITLGMNGGPASMLVETDELPDGSRQISRIIMIRRFSD